MARVLLVCQKCRLHVAVGISSNENLIRTTVVFAVIPHTISVIRSETHTPRPLDLMDRQPVVGLQTAPVHTPPTFLHPQIPPLQNVYPGTNPLGIGHGTCKPTTESDSNRSQQQPGVRPRRCLGETLGEREQRKAAPPTSHHLMASAAPDTRQTPQSQRQIFSLTLTTADPPFSHRRETRPGAGASELLLGAAACYL